MPEKGQKQFKEIFSEKLSEAIAASKVHNAKDAAKKLGWDGSGLEEKRSHLRRGKDLIKFGGGFYCGKVDGVYVMNGFYMQMRSAYTNPGENINYYSISWLTDDLSWADFFRGTWCYGSNRSSCWKRMINYFGQIKRSWIDHQAQYGR